MNEPLNPVLIAGAGPVGLCAALALHQMGVPVRVIDARTPGEQDIDPRAIALSHGSRLVLERLGVWKDLPATGIAHIHVSQQGGFGQTRIEAADHKLAELGHVTRLGKLISRLRQAAIERNISIEPGCSLVNVSSAADHALAHIRRSGVDSSFQTPLIVIAEGKPGADATRKAYGQTAIVTEAWCTDGHDARAFERFTPAGPLALLPLDNGYSVVWCMRDADAKSMLQYDDAQFLHALREATGFARRDWTRIAARAAFPLELVRAPVPTHARTIALGNASQTLHPVAGQGLNLGLRDAFELADSLKDGLSQQSVQAYQRRRAQDRDATATLTDQYVSVFSNEFSALRIARGLGLTAINLLPPVRHAIARRMMFGLR